MSTSKLFVTAGLVSVIAISSISSSAFAWHPEGQIVKKVQNVTTNGTASDANDATSAISAKPGDILKYTIEVSNIAKPASRQYNDLDKTVMKDTLPAGVELVGEATKRQITENLGLIVPGKKVVKEYTVKVTSTTNGTITNEACYIGDSVVNDRPQKGCDSAVINVKVPIIVMPLEETPEAPVVETPKTEAPKAAEMPVELPKTGVANSALATFSLGAVMYAAVAYLRSRQSSL